MKGIPERGNALETEPTLDDTSDYRFENLYRENRIEKRLDSQYPYLDLPFFRICDTFGGKSIINWVKTPITVVVIISQFFIQLLPIQVFESAV